MAIADSRPARRTVPYGERSVYEKLGRDLDKDWVVLHSLGLHGHETKIWGEADIVVLSTKGIFALEVKGGQGVLPRRRVDLRRARTGRATRRGKIPGRRPRTTMFAVEPS